MFVKVPGTTVELGGILYVMPPLALGVLEQLGPELTDLISASGYTPERMKLIIDIIHGALKRNYPDMDRSVVGDNVDVGNMMMLLMALFERSGLSKEVREGDAPGETLATGPSSGST